MPDTTKRAWQGLLRASYAGGSPAWPGTASAGGSGTRSADDATLAPGTGATQNALVAARGDGVSNRLTCSGIVSDYIGGTGAAWTFQSLLRWNTDVASGGGPASDPCILTDNGGNWGISLATGGITVSQFDNAVVSHTVTCTTIAAASASIFLIQARFDGSKIWIRVNRGAWFSVTCTSFWSAVLTNAINIFENFSSAAFLDADVWEWKLIDSALSDNQLDDEGIYFQERYALSLGFPLPVARKLYPDFIDRRQHHRAGIHASQMQATARSFAATLAPAPTNRKPVHPDVFDRHARIALTHASRAPFTTAINAFPWLAGASSALKTQPPEFPDLFDQHWRRRFVHASHQLAVTELSPLPERKSPIASTEFPDAITKLFLRAEQQLAASDWSPIQFAATLTPVALTSYPDAVARPFLRAEQQQATTSETPSPERSAVLTDVSFPATVARPFLRAEQQLATTSLSPAPERSSSLVVAIFPDAVIRLYLATANHLATTSETPAPERTSTIAAVSFPDAVYRPWFRVEQQVATTSLSPAPERTAALVATSFPDFATRAMMHASRQLAATSLSPFPERTSPIAIASYPDAVLRLFLRADQQMAAADLDGFPFGAGASSALLFQPPVYPASAFRPSLHASAQLYTTAMTPFPLSLSVVPYALTDYPDFATRPAMLAAEQLAVTQINPLPFGAGASSALLFQPPVFPSSVARPFLRADSQQAITSLSPLPIPNATTPVGLTSYPDSITRPSLLVAAQMAWTASALPERTTPAAAAFYPDRALRAVMLTSEHLAVSSLSPVPEQTSAHDWCVTAPEWIARATFATANHLATARSMQPEQAAPLDWDAIFPEAAKRPTFPTSQQLAFATSPQPERTSAMATGWAPERVFRPTFAASLQQAVATGLRPEQTSVLDWQAFYPSSVARPMVLTSQQVAFVGPLRVVATIANASASYPDFARRPFLATSSQRHWAFGTLITPAAIIILPACLSGVLAIATSLTGAIVDSIVVAATLQIATSALGAIGVTTIEDGLVALASADTANLQGCDE